MKYLSVVVLVMFQVSVCNAGDFDLTKLGKAKPLKAQAEPIVQVTKPEVKIDCSTGTCKVVTGVGDGNTQVVVPPKAEAKKATVATSSKRWGITGYQRVGLFGRRPVYGWISASRSYTRSSTCSTGTCSGGG